MAHITPVKRRWTVHVPPHQIEAANFLGYVIEHSRLFQLDRPDKQQMRKIADQINRIARYFPWGKKGG